MTVLLTGASGFVGRELLKQLSGQPVRTLQRPAQDLLDADSLIAACSGVDTLYHLAAYAHVNQAQEQQLYAINVDGTRNLLQAAINADVRHLIYVSSILADPAHDSPRTAYGRSKLQAEQLLAKAHQQGLIRVSIIRPVNVYGAGMKGNLMTLLRLIHRGVLPPLPDFAQPFSLIGVEDLCAGIRQAAEVPAARAGVAERAGADAPIYVLSDGCAYHIKALEAAMHQALGKPAPRWSSPRWSFYLGALALETAGRLLRLKNSPGLRSYRALSRNNSVDSTASWQQLGYNPRLTFYTALPHIIAHHGLDS